MKRHHLAAVTALSLAFASTAHDAAAQEGPAAPAAPAPAGAPTASNGGAVRIHVRTYRNKGTARLYIHRADGSYTLVCASPCTADVPGGSELRATLANKDDEPHTFVLPNDLGSEIDLEVRPASVGPLIGSVVTMGVGGVLVLSGLLLVALSDIKYGTTSSFSTQRDISSTYKTSGFVMIGLGAAAAVTGFIWFLSRSHEPQVVDAPHRQPDEVYGRRDTFLSDLAVAKPRDPTTIILESQAPVRSTPLQYGFTF